MAIRPQNVTQTKIMQVHLPSRVFWPCQPRAEKSEARQRFRSLQHIRRDTETALGKVLCRTWVGCGLWEDRRKLDVAQRIQTPQLCPKRLIGLRQNFVHLLLTNGVVGSNARTSSNSDLISSGRPLIKYEKPSFRASATMASSLCTEYTTT